MHLQEIKDNFNLAAEEYDSQRKKLIPCFDDYYITMINFISHYIKPPRLILDLGAGTGLLTQCLFQHFPNSEYVLVDISEQMLNIAKKRFQGLPNFTYEVCDYSTYFPNRHYDVIASALSIHHLDHSDKINLYKRIYKSLTEDGCFINLDQFNASSPRMNTYYDEWWYNSIIHSGLPKSELDSVLKRRKLDRENTIEETLTMLRGAGFTLVECIYRYMKFGVILAMNIT
ncbi:MAG: class I SAM-dependent methyltransferase [Desulfobacterales bacterium]|nr:class I SAM-dependent methyltransferase [Desulfobacterales bacterium]